MGKRMALFDISWGFNLEDNFLSPKFNNEILRLIEVESLDVYVNEVWDSWDVLILGFNNLNLTEAKLVVERLKTIYPQYKPDICVCIVGTDIQVDLDKVA